MAALAVGVIVTQVTTSFAEKNESPKGFATISELRRFTEARLPRLARFEAQANEEIARHMFENPDPVAGAFSQDVYLNQMRLSRERLLPRLEFLGWEYLGGRTIHDAVTEEVYLLRYEKVPGFWRIRALRQHGRWFLLSVNIRVGPEGVDEYGFAPRVPVTDQVDDDAMRSELREEVEQLSDGAFAAVRERLDMNVFGEETAPAARRQLEKQAEAFQKAAGPGLEYEFIGSQALGERLRRYVFMAVHQRAVVLWTFLAYRADEKWRYAHLRVDVNDNAFMSLPFELADPDDAPKGP